jgi:hypothetical protein
MEPTWRKLTIVKLDARPRGLWSLVAEYVPGSRLLRLQVLLTHEHRGFLPASWSPIDGTTCQADGVVSTPPKSGFLSLSAPYGALIGKVGGSSADLPDSSMPAAPYGTDKRVFTVGSYCVVSIGVAEGGPLYLTMNDSPDGFTRHSGALRVLVEEYPR